MLEAVNAVADETGPAEEEVQSVELDEEAPTVRKAGNKRLRASDEPIPEPTTHDDEKSDETSGTGEEEAGEGAETPEPEAAPETPEGTEDAQEEEAVEIVPWKFKAYGSEVAIEGAQYKPGHGAFIPEDSLGNARQLLARGMKYPQVVEANEQLRSKLTSTVSRKEVEAQAVLETLAPVLTPQWISEASVDPELAIERLAVALGRKQNELERKFASELSQADRNIPDPSSDLEERKAEHLESVFEEAVRSPEIARMLTTPKQREHLQRSVAQVAPAFFVTAPMDAPDGSFRKGETVLDTYRLMNYMKEQSEILSKATQPKPVAAPAKPISVIKAPPSVSAKVTKTSTQAAPIAAPSKPKGPPSKKDIMAELNQAMKEMGA